MPSMPAAANRTYTFKPASTALIIIDMQRDFIEDGGACGASGANVKPLQDIVPRVREVLDAFRRANATIVHTRYGVKPDLSNLTRVMRYHSRQAGCEYGTPGPLGRILTEGEPGFQIINQLSPQHDEVVINKSTFGAFTFTKLDTVLKSKGITHVVVCGVTTQCCVESTLREAVDRGYFVLTLADCCGAVEDTLQQGTLRAIASEANILGWIGKGADAVNALRDPKVSTANDSSS
ncbi:MAG: isochorismatase family cysteine hydrolase [Pseudomonadota bacterium]